MTLLIPHDLVTLNGRLFVHWLNCEALDLSPGFFREAVHALPDKDRLARVTPFATLLDTVATPGQLAGLIFHTSRCGSTLACQMLKQHPEAAVLGEPVLLNRIVRSPALSRLEKVRALRQSIGLLARWARQSDRRLIIKLSSWNLLAVNLYREAVTCPTLYVYRHYLPVLESLLRKPPHWLASDWLPSLLVSSNVELDAASTLSLDPLNRAGQLYLQFAAAIGAAMTHDGHAQVLGYESLLSRGTALLRCFDLPFSEAVTRNMTNAARLDAKSGEPFSPREDQAASQQLQTTLKARHPTLARQLETAYDVLQALEKQRIEIPREHPVRHLQQNSG